MTDFKSYKTKWLKVDLTANNKSLVIKKLGTSRQSSMDKKIVKDRIIPQFPIKLAASTNSIDSEDIPENEYFEKLEFKSSDEEKTRVDSNDARLKTGRLTTEYSSSTEKSSVCKKRISLTDSRYIYPKVRSRYPRMLSSCSNYLFTALNGILTDNTFYTYIKNHQGVFEFFVGSQ